MDEKFKNLIENTTEKFTVVGEEVQGIALCDKNGLLLTSKDVSISPGPIARLAELGSSLTGRRTTVCLENNEAQVIVHHADKAVVAIYTKRSN